jgi:arylsulfatase A-like enzyme
MAATVRAIAEAPSIPNGEGRSLLGCLKGGDLETRAVSVSENWGFAAFEADRYKLVVDEDALAPCQLFDLVEDPTEDHNLVSDPLCAPVVEELLELHVRPFFASPPARPHPSIFTGGAWD